MLFTIPDDGEKVVKNKNCKSFKSSVLTSFCLKNKAKVLNSYVIKCPRLGTTERCDDIRSPSISFTQSNCDVTKSIRIYGSLLGLNYKEMEAKCK